MLNRQLSVTVALALAVCSGVASFGQDLQPLQATPNFWGDRPRLLPPVEPALAGPNDLPEVIPRSSYDPPEIGQSSYTADPFSELLRRLDSAESELRKLRAEQAGGSLVEQAGYQEPDVFKMVKQEVDDADQKVPGDEPGKPVKPEDFPTFNITGFTQLDTDWNWQDAENMATVGNMQDGAGFRRARLATVGKAAEMTNYMLEVDFATAGRPSFFDVWAEQTNLNFLGTLRAGQYVQPFSVDAMSGFRNLVFLERSLPFFAFVPFRRIGIEAYNSTDDEMTNWAFSGFRTGGFNNAAVGDSRFGSDFGDIGGYSFSTRITQLLYYDPQANDRYLFHVGAAYNFSQLGANTAAGSVNKVPFYQARTGPEFFLGYPENVPATFGPNTAFAGTPNFVDTGRFEASNFNLFGLELVGQSGPTSFQAEWMGVVVNSAVGPIFYNGAYAQVAYRLTGEHRVYFKKIGAFGNVVPYTDFISLKPGSIAGWGAWEVALRWSFVALLNPASLDGHYLANTNSSGNGGLNDATVGMTWFMNQHTKLQFNWICAMLDNRDKGYSMANLYVTRLQVDF